MGKRMCRAAGSNLPRKWASAHQAGPLACSSVKFMQGDRKERAQRVEGERTRSWSSSLELLSFQVSCASRRCFTDACSSASTRAKEPCRSSKRYTSSLRSLLFSDSLSFVFSSSPSRPAPPAPKIFLTIVSPCAGRHPQQLHLRAQHKSRWQRLKCHYSGWLYVARA
jgi:hypothetical protein